MKKSVSFSKNTPKDSTLSRRDFIKVAGVFAGSVALAACEPQLTATPIPMEATATFSPIPTDALIPTPTVDAMLVNMAEGDKLIWDSMPESMPDVDGSYRVFDRERGFVYKDKDGKVVGLWDYNTYKLGDPNPNLMRKAWIDEESGHLKFIDPRDGKERIKYPEVIKVTLIDDGGNVIENKFNGVELHTTARNYKLNPQLSREVVGESGDLAQMMAILEEAYRLKLLPQFVEGTMIPADLDGPLPFRENTLVKPIWEMPSIDHAQKRWLGENLLPYTPVVFEAVDGGGMRWTPALMKQNDGTVAGWWAITLKGRDSNVELVKGVNASVQSLLDNGIFDVDGGLGGRVSKDQYVRSGRGMLNPVRIKDESAFAVMANQKIDDKLLALFAELQAVKDKQKALYEGVLSTGTIPEGCKDGSMPAFAIYCRTSAA